MRPAIVGLSTGRRWIINAIGAFAKGGDPIDHAANFIENRIAPRASFFALNAPSDV